MENTIYYFFSTIAQCIAALVALLGVFVTFKLQNIKDSIEKRSTKISQAFSGRQWNFLLKAENVEERISLHVDEEARALDIWKILKDFFEVNNDKYDGFFKQKFNSSDIPDKETDVSKQKRICLDWRHEFYALNADIEKRPQIIRNLKRETGSGLVIIILCFIGLLLPQFSLSSCTIWILIAVSMLLTSAYVWLVFRLVTEIFD